MFNHPEKIRKATMSEEFKFKEMDKTGQIAKILFPEGIDLPTGCKKNLKWSIRTLNKKNGNCEFNTLVEVMIVEKLKEIVE